MKRMTPLYDEIEFAEELLNSVSVGVALVDEAGTVTFCNRCAGNIFACESKEILGKKLSQWVPEPYRSELDTFIARRIGKIASEGEAFERHVILQREDGSVLSM